MDDTAVKPSFHQSFTSGVDKAVEVNEPDANQQALAHITHFKGWELLKEYKVRLEEHLDSLVSESIAKGLSMHEIGERTMVKEMSKFVLNSFIKKAEDARKYEDR